MTTLTTIKDGLAFPEGPRWHDGKFWFSDMHAFRVWSMNEDGSEAEAPWGIPARPSGLGWLPNGDILIVSMMERRLFHAAPGGLKEHANLAKMASFHCNDMVVDSKGRAYVGNFGFDLDMKAKLKPAELILVEPDGTARVVAEDMIFPNGAVITPDEKVLIIAETFASRLTAFDIEEDGSLSNRRVWAQIDGISPDGICLDEEGQIWVACPATNRVVRVKVDGEITDQIDTGRPAFACMLGGSDGKTLFICTSSVSSPMECAEKRDGKIETTKVSAGRAGYP